MPAAHVTSTRWPRPDHDHAARRFDARRRRRDHRRRSGRRHRSRPGQGGGDRRRQRRRARPRLAARRRRRGRDRHDRRATAASTRSATRRPTCWPRRCSTCSPGATFGIGPPVEDGFYYDFELPDGGTFDADDLARIEARMREIIAEQQPFVRDEIADGRRPASCSRTTRSSSRSSTAQPTTRCRRRSRARAHLREPAALHRPVPRPARRAHGPPSRPLQADARRRRVLARRREEPELQRIYGTAWASKADLDAHLHRLEEAAKRDHRKLGVELDLFSFPDEIGSGLAVFHPKGGIVRRLMEDYSPPAPRAGRLRVRQLAAHHQGGAVRDVRPPRLVRRRHVPADGARRGARSTTSSR